MNQIRPFWLLAISVLTAGTLYAQGRAFDPQATIRGVVGLIEKEHLSRKRVGEEQSRRWFRAFLDRLDPQRMYFLQPDVDELGASDDRLGDLARQGSFDLPQRVRKRYQERVKQAVAYAEEFLTVRH